MAKQPQVEATTSPKSDKKLSNLYFVVETKDKNGKLIGSRLVDMYHFGTRDWLYDKHLWWALHNQDEVSVVDIRVATQDEIAQHLEDAKKELAAKFNSNGANGTGKKAA